MAGRSDLVETHVFDHLARATTRWPKTIVVAALIFIGVCGVFAIKATKDMQTAGYTNPSSQSAQAEALLQQKFAVGQPNLVLLVNAPSGINNPAVSAEAKTLTAELASRSQIIGVSSYWSTHSPLMRAKDGKSGLIVGYIKGTQNQQSDLVNAIEPDLSGKHGPVIVQIGGTAVVNGVLVSTVRHDIEVAERIGFPLTALVLILVFQSFIASFLPLLVGLVAAVGTLAELRGLSSATSVSIFSISLATGLSTGLASDYGLFIVKRYRDEYHSGLPAPEAIRVTLNTAGRTVLYSSLTVTVAMCSLLVFPGYYLRSFGYTGISVVLLAAIAALTVLPAALFLLGRHVDSLNPVKLLRLGRRRGPTASAVTASAVTAPRAGAWERIAEAVMRRPLLYALSAIALLAVMIVPFVHVHFGLPDDRDLPAGAPSHVVQQTLRDDYSGQITNQLDVVANGINPTARAAAIGAYARQLSTVSDVVSVTAVTGVYAHGRQVSPAGPATRQYATSDATYLAVASSANQDSAAGNAQVAAIRAVPAPFPTLTGGADADLVDTLAGMGSALPWAILIVAGASLTLIFLLTGAVLIALKALLMNMVTLGATVGALVWVFQYGHFSGLLNFLTTNSLDVALLVLLFCVAFGVSMDFEVFLLSRIKEEYKRTGDNRTAIAFGISKTGSVVTAAASITAVVFLVIGLTANVTTIKMLGWGMALALILDATVIRSILVPALMRMLGKRCWWRPVFMDGLYRRFRLQDERETERRISAGQATGRPTSSPRAR